MKTSSNSGGRNNNNNQTSLTKLARLSHFHPQDQGLNLGAHFLVDKRKLWVGSLGKVITFPPTRPRLGFLVASVYPLLPRPHGAGPPGPCKFPYKKKQQ